MGGVNIIKTKTIIFVKRNKKKYISLTRFSFMNKKLIISAIAATVLLSATGQINSPKNDGYYDRAMFMYQDENYQGCEPDGDESGVRYGLQFRSALSEKLSRSLEKQIIES